MTDAAAGIGFLVRLGSAAVGGLLVSAAAFKVVSGNEFPEWMARLVRLEAASTPLKWLAAMAIGVEIAVGTALLLQPALPVLLVAWWFCLGLSAIQLTAWIRGIGPCACFGSSSESQGAALGPFLAPALVACISAFLWLEPSAAVRLVLWEDLLLAGAGLTCSLTLLILAEAPRGLQRLRVPEVESE